MGKKRGRAKQGKAAAPNPANDTGPTPEQMGDGAFRIGDVVDKGEDGRTIKIGKAYRRRPMIDTLAEQGLFTDAEHKALHHYRHHADMADRSLVRDSLDMQRFGGSGSEPTNAMLSAIRIRDDCERAAQSLLPILRAVVIDDKSLSQWAIEQAGAIEDCEVKKGERVCRLKPRQKALAIAKLDIQMVAKRVHSELTA